MKADHRADAEALARVQAYLAARDANTFRTSVPDYEWLDGETFDLTLADLRRVVDLADARSDAR